MIRIQNFYFDTVLKHNLFQKFKLIGRSKFNYLINTLIHTNCHDSSHGTYHLNH
jgi:hypothetical protein